MVSMFAQITAPSVTTVNDWLGSAGTGAYAVATVLIAVNLAFFTYHLSLIHISEPTRPY